MQIDSFRHIHAGHCESGVMASLLTHYGMPLSEPMAFGLSSSLVFSHIPFVKMGGIPLTAYRMLPGNVVRGLERNLGITVQRRRFKEPAQATRALNDALDKGRPVGLQTSVYWLPYFPPDMRFHFNAHNLIVYGRENGEYLISDPVFDQPQRCPAADLEKARFALGPFAPKGLMYYPTTVPEDYDFRSAVRRALKRTVNVNMRTPLPIIGVRAIRRMARTIRGMEYKQPDARYPRLFVGSVIRMQEEIGTGGGGFRFMYGSFLQEAARRLDNDELAKASESFTVAGDHWRMFALRGARFCRKDDALDYAGLSDALLACAEREETAFNSLRRGLKTL